MPDDYGYPAGAKQRSDYEPFRLVNVWKKAKTLTKTTYRKASYKSKELMEKFEVWARRERGSR